jgi:hypothetical protein
MALNALNLTTAGGLASFFAEQPWSRRFRRSIPCLSLLLHAIRELGVRRLHRHHKCQIKFRYYGEEFKLRFNRPLKGNGRKDRGGWEILPVLDRQGKPDGQVLFRATTFRQAGEACTTLQGILDAYLSNT